jgi:hypothetical protein
VSKTTSNRLALVLALAMLALLTASVPLYLRTESFGTDNIGPEFLVLPFAAVGLFIALRRPHNPIGWMLAALALLMMVSGDAGMYSLLAFRLGHPTLPLARLATALTQTWVALLILLPLPILLFPDGRLPTPRWRWSLGAYLLIGATLLVSNAVQDAHAFTERVVRVDSTGELTGLGSRPLSAIPLPAIYGLIVLGWVIGKIFEYRRSQGEHRQQLKWLMAGGAVSFGALFSTLTFGGGGFFVGIVALPISIGVGILKYRLYDIDRLISRTLSYAIVTGLLVAVFIGLVSLTTDVLPFSSPVGVAASTLAAAALFNPLRRRVQLVVDRRFNRARYDAEATVQGFALHLRSSIDVDAVEAALRDAIRTAFEPSSIGVWTRGRP